MAVKSMDPETLEGADARTYASCLSVFDFEPQAPMEADKSAANEAKDREAETSKIRRDTERGKLT